MKAVGLEKIRKIVVRDVRDPEMKETTNVLLRLTSTTICKS
jgi:threonine dehydrogenase-like Zn-dependent dehydrogenase